MIKRHVLIKFSFLAEYAVFKSKLSIVIVLQILIMRR